MNLDRWKRPLLLLLFLLCCFGSTVDAGSRSGISRHNLAVVVNDADPLSRWTAVEYQLARQIPPENIIHVSIDPVAAEITEEEFLQVYERVKASTPGHIQAYALSWTLPYRVGCMSITSAFAFGFDKAFCASGCKRTLSSPYFNSSSRFPYSELGLRPTMMIAGVDQRQIAGLINRGVASDGTNPEGTAYLLTTSDKARSTRTPAFKRLISDNRLGLPVEHLYADSLGQRDNVLFYLTGSVHVRDLQMVEFLPGALADHLTSHGGRLDGVKQMSILRWLEAGATASYGTVVEPCSFPQKFPHPEVLIPRYVNGETAIEAYWKSVAWPGQGVFVGEPLARPFRAP